MPRGRECCKKQGKIAEPDLCVKEREAEGKCCKHIENRLAAAGKAVGELDPAITQPLQLQFELEKMRLEH